LQGATLDTAIAQAAHDAAAEPLQDLLAYRQALRERADPARLVARLMADIADLERRSGRLADQAAEFFGKAAYRDGRGDKALGDDFQRRAEALEAAAAALREQAFLHQLQADAVRARLVQAAELMAIGAA
jgi:hypothetical protein